jgi:hypothetical protein
MPMPPLSVEAGVLLGLVAIGLIIGFWVVRPRYVLWRDQRNRQKLLDSLSVECLHDVAVADGTGGYLHVDYVLLTPRGVLVLDFWDVLGNVFGSDPMTHWTVTRATHRHTFPNPQAALYDRLAALRVILGDVPVEGRIVFADSAQFPKGMPRFTVLESKLTSEFFFGERHLAERAVDPWRSGWESLKGGVKPSIGPGRSL